MLIDVSDKAKRDEIESRVPTVGINKGVSRGDKLLFNVCSLFEVSKSRIASLT